MLPCGCDDEPPSNHSSVARRGYPRVMHQLRLLTEEDAAEFWRFRLAALEQAPESFAESADELRSSPLEETALRLRASSDENFVLGAFVDGRLGATVGFFRNRGIKTKHKGRVWGLYVEQTLRRHGIARSMMDELLLRVRGVA